MINEPNAMIRTMRLEFLERKEDRGGGGLLDERQGYTKKAGELAGERQGCI